MGERTPPGLSAEQACLRQAVSRIWRRWRACTIFCWTGPMSSDFDATLDSS